MSPTVQLATLPLQVPSLLSARSPFQRAHVPSAVPRSPMTLPALPPVLEPALPPVAAPPLPPELEPELPPVGMPAPAAPPEGVPPEGVPPEGAPLEPPVAVPPALPPVAFDPDVPPVVAPPLLSAASSTGGSPEHAASAAHDRASTRRDVESRDHDGSMVCMRVSLRRRASTGHRFAHAMLARARTKTVIALGAACLVFPAFAFTSGDDIVRRSDGTIV